jgi:hypothetical protein
MDVTRVHWPAEAERRADLRRRGVPCLMLVDRGDVPPDDVDVLEDWARVGAAERDLVARELTLALRAARLTSPSPHGDGRSPLRSRPDSW